MAYFSLPKNMLWPSLCEKKKSLFSTSFFNEHVGSLSSTAEPHETVVYTENFLNIQGGMYPSYFYAGFYMEIGVPSPFSELFVFSSTAAHL
jgi:hypothetical protein